MGTFKYLFGPVPSRRLGRSLGVDLTPHKTCTENCVFCQVGATTCLTLERKEYVPVAEVLDELRAWGAAGGQADFITLSGSGEPTLHSRFGDILDFAASALNTRTALLTNGSLLYLPEVREAAARADLVKVTLSAWDEDSFRRLHQPAAGLTFARLWEGEQAFRREYRGRLWVEVMLLAGVNDAPGGVERLAQLVQQLTPERIHLNTLVRPAWDAHQRAVPRPQLEAFAARFTPVAEIPEYVPDGKAVARQHVEESLLTLLQRHPCTLEELVQVSGMRATDTRRLLDELERAGKIRPVPGTQQACYVAVVPGQDGHTA